MSQTEAPALTRGIALLNALSDGEPARLESLSARSGVPKSSALRLLNTLDGLGLVMRDPETRCYHALWRLTPMRVDMVEFEDALRAELAALEEATGQTAEWWAPGEGALQLAMRRAPEHREVSVRSRIGSKFEPHKTHALPLLGHTHFGYRLAPRRNMITWDERGSPIPAPGALVTGLLEQAKRSDSIVDPVPNAAGVRRLARVIRAPDGPRGVLCIATGLRPWVEDLRAEYGAAFDRSVRRLEAISHAPGADRPHTHNEGA